MAAIGEQVLDEQSRAGRLGAVTCHPQVGRQDHRVGHDVEADVIETGLAVEGVAVDHQAGPRQTPADTVAHPEAARRDGRQVAAQPHQQGPTLLPAILLQHALYHHVGGAGLGGRAHHYVPHEERGRQLLPGGGQRQLIFGQIMAVIHDAAAGITDHGHFIAQPQGMGSEPFGRHSFIWQSCQQTGFFQRVKKSRR